MRRTKIVCTIGPASDSLQIIKKMICNGMNVARLNFSHGTHEEHTVRIALIRQAAGELNAVVGIMLDTKGPEVRTGLLEADKVSLEVGKHIILTTEDVKGTAERLSVSYKGLPGDVRQGSKILIADGLVELEVEFVEGTEIHCHIVNGGLIGSRKNINLPGQTVNLPIITERDIADIRFAVANDFDFIAASFVRTASDVLEIRKVLEENESGIEIIAKIENHQGVENIDEILKVADGIMVARGDLGVETLTEEVPLIQKMIIEKCNRLGKPVITATQMLDSMISNPRPTRAEATDVANAIFDGTDALMLSGETAAGSYPVEAVAMMERIATRTERALGFKEILGRKEIAPGKTVTDAISYATCATAFDLGAAAIITSTKSGYTARMVSKYRPQARVIAVTPNMDVVRQLTIVWGVSPLMVPETECTDEMIDAAISGALHADLIQSGDLVVITAGIPVGVPGTTNMIKVHIVGDVIARGTGIGARAVTGTVRVVADAQEANRVVVQGDILVTASTDRAFIPAMKRAGAVITEAGGLTSHAAIVGINLGIPVIVGVDNASAILESGTIITIDGTRGLIYRGHAKVL
ncbi:pyruvate kinase [Phosphitispora sp. TUW77]|uniref:pyruvate kinase n=1 Tax=Phosphitispora sp. TUW77 TaxID=3152361 RepID=UPI003AB62FF9